MNYLVKRTLVPGLEPESHENRTRLGILAGWVSVVISIVLASAKFVLGQVSGSISMMADAVNNLTDVGSSLIIALGFQWSRKPRDEEHPFGHGRVETVTALVLAMALIVVGFEVAHSGVMRLINPQPINAPVWLLVAIGVTVAVKSWMAVFARQLARMTKSQVLEADAWNHTFDIVCSLMVVLALVSSRMGWGAVDGWTAVGVAGFIFYTGISYARDAVDVLLGKRVDPRLVKKINNTVLSVDGVLSAHEIMVHHYGDVKMVSFHIEVDAGLSLKKAHDISEAAETAVEEQFNWRALAHLDPVDRSHSFFETLSRAVSEFVDSDSRLIDAHDLRAEGKIPPYRVSFDLVTDMKTGRDQYDEIYGKCLVVLKQMFGSNVSHAEIGIEAIVESAPMDRRRFDLSGGSASRFRD